MSASTKKRVRMRHSMEKKVSSSDDKTEGLTLRECRDQDGAMSPIGGAEDDGQAQVPSCRYGLRSGARRKANTTDARKSSVVRKRARKADDEDARPLAETDRIVKSLEGEFLSLETSKGILFGRAVLTYRAM